MMTLTLTLNATDLTAMVEALAIIKADIASGVTVSEGYTDESSYDFEVTPTEDEAEDPEYDWDGQPDEAQEWYDFDPDA